jgi:outer membrane protein TolC
VIKDKPKLIKYSLIALLITIVMPDAQASENTLTISAQQAVDMAMKNNHTIKSLDHQLKGTEYSIKSAVTSFLPRVVLNGSYGHLGIDAPATTNTPTIPPPVEFDLGDQYVLSNISNMMGGGISLTTDNSYSLGLQIQQPIFTGFATINGLRAAQVSRAMQEKSNEKIRQTIHYAILQVYWGLVSLEKSETVALEATRQLDELTANQQARMEQGMVTEHDYLLAKASLAQAKMNELNINKTVSSMKRQLATLLGMPSSTVIILSDTNITTRSTEKVDLDSAVHHALMTRPDLGSSRLSLRLAEINTKVTKSAFYPTLVGGFGYSQSRPDRSYKDQWGDSWNVSLALNFTLLDWGNRSFQLRKAYEQELTYTELLKEKESTVEKEVYDAYYDVDQSQLKLETAELLVEAREKSYEAALAKHDEGVISMYELLDAYNTFVAAKYQVLQSATSLELAIINLDLGGQGTGSK